MAVKRETATSAQRRASRAGTKGMPRAEREQQLLDVGERAFGERGYDAVSMEDVATEAGVTKPLIYAYFDSKEGFLAAGMRRAYERFAERIEKASAGGEAPDQRLWRINLAVFAWFERYRWVWPVIWAAQARGGPIAAVATRAREDIVALIAQKIRELVPGDVAASAEIEPLAEAAVALNTGLAERWARHPEEPLELQALRAQNILWPGLERLIEGRLWTPPEA